MGDCIKPMVLVPRAKKLPARSFGKHPGGRPSKYDPRYCDALLTFFTREKFTVGAFGKLVPTEPPYFSAFARSLGVDDTTLDEWAKVHPKFSLAIKSAKRLQEEHLVTCGFLGASNPAVTIFLLKNNHGYKDRESNGNGSNGDTHYHYTTINVDAPQEELASAILARLSRRTPSPAA